jgi:excisionase family DNA binding protein
MAQTSPDFLKIPEAAAAFGVSEKTIRNWIHDGQLPAAQPGGPGHSVRIDRRDLLRPKRRGEKAR